MNKPIQCVVRIEAAMGEDVLGIGVVEVVT